MSAGADAGAAVVSAQRMSAMVLALCVVVHLGGMIYAVRGGLTAAEILGRTRGNWAFGAFYAVFVVRLRDPRADRRRQHRRRDDRGARASLRSVVASAARARDPRDGTARRLRACVAS